MSVEEHLRSHGLRVTSIRKDVLDLLQRSDRALSQADVERALPDRADRVTLFRVLQSFEEAGLAHRVMDVQGVSHYATCAASCSAHAHHDMHAHFRCTGCAGVFCLDEVTMPEVRLPAGFRLMESRLELMGLCSSCS
ncbi:MAG: Fur family transcriptional regulator [Flavobacteriales bacterium]|jgi:Fur family ferric uptake transcriptional regulator